MEFELTSDQQRIASLIENSNSNILVHGKPGVGKSVLIRWLVQNSNKTYTLGAPTGLAALNIGGKTLHSLFGIPVSKGIIHPSFNNFTNNDNIINNLKYRVKHLIIDEISMVRADTFDYIDRLLKYVKGNQMPFGGVQVIAIGDFFQLPPVSTSEDLQQLYECAYESSFVFDSRAFSNGYFSLVSLDEVVRQKGDKKFIKILHNARTGDMQEKDIEVLNKCVKPASDMRIKLTGTNKQADELNAAELSKIDSPTHYFIAKKFGEWPALPVEEELHLKVGAQVIVKMNSADRPETWKGEWKSKVVNGTLAKIVAINDKKTEDSEEPFAPHVVIEMEDGTQAKIYRRRWESKIKEKVGDQWTEKIVASYDQMPLSLAWAISIHKSQGQSFDKLHVDATKIFAPGQLYVALSRCRSLKGLSLQVPVSPKKFWANADVKNFFSFLNSNINEAFTSKSKKD